jgi:selT/selW/selH-like putative selenoprotein
MGANAQVSPGQKGMFDVKVDGELVFSKYTIGHLPSAEEIIAILKEKKGSS